MSLWSSYLALSPRTKLLFGLGLMSYAAIGLWTSPKVEEKMGMVATKEEKDELDRKMKVGVSTVEK